MPDQKFRPDGVRAVYSRVGYFALKRRRREWRSYVEQIPPAPLKTGQGRGIVICGGGFCYFTCAWINIRILRKQGCRLPIELWHLDYEMTDAARQELEKLGVRCRSFSEIGGLRLRGYQLKPYAILHSGFSEILFLDADNICTRDPAYLFESAEFRNSGAVFWPDHWRTEESNPIWQVIGCAPSPGFEQESGQILIEKRQSWRALHLCCYFNRMSDFYYQLLHGDKDTFKFAWMALGSPFHMIETEMGQCGYQDQAGSFIGTTMVQHDFDGEIVFLHRNFRKWDTNGADEYVWREIRTFKKGLAHREYHVRSDPPSVDLRGDIQRRNFASLFKGLEEECLAILKELRESSFYGRYLIDFYIRIMRGQGGPRV